jgi:hypothetical protein
MSEKTVSQINGAGLFLGLTVADESPLEPGVWLMPAGTVDAIPPGELAADGAFTPGWTEAQWPRWNGAAFELITKPEVPAEPTAAEKLAAFLAQNPDVAAMVGGAS